MLDIRGHILTPTGFVIGQLSVNEFGRIESLIGQPVSESLVRQSKVPCILPGFIDLHVHGGGGFDVMQGGEALSKVSHMHAQYGTTAMLATTMTAPAVDLEFAFSATQGAFQATVPSGARVLGVHLEGPFISEDKLGAQPNFARGIQMAELARLNALTPIRLITLAPEVSGNMALIESLCAEGFKVQIGHTAGTYEEGVQALAHGASGFTHLFNAMTGLAHRAPGMVGAALAHAQHSEIIPDLIHVHPGAIRVALRAIPGLFCVTDSTSAAGMPDGEYLLGRHKVMKCMGGVRLANGTLAGSTLTMDQALRNLVTQLGLSLQEASARVSSNAAAYLGEEDRGQLKIGAWADLVVLDQDLTIQNVYVEGRAIEITHAD